MITVPVLNDYGFPPCLVDNEPACNGDVRLTGAFEMHLSYCLPEPVRVYFTGPANVAGALASVRRVYRREAERLKMHALGDLVVDSFRIQDNGVMTVVIDS